MNGGASAFGVRDLVRAASGGRDERRGFACG